ncbi:MAG: TonB-dependent receptor plug domain-containing protein [Bacteroidetes bacterium]|nr:TonB-dependent receptor plug domain-containing protein [Bacteroidota bacterium]
MVRNLLLILALVLGGSATMMAQTALSGKVTDTESGEPVLFGNVKLYLNGVYKTGTQTDFDGNYSFSPIDAGTYDVEVSYVGYTTQRTEGVVVKAGKENRLDIALSEGVTMDVVEVIGYKVPLIDQDNTESGGQLTGDQVMKLPSKSINGIVGNVAGVASADDGDNVTIKGSRSNATVYFLDGVRVRGALPPQTEVEQLQVITGGVGAQYGDVTGGIISITTRGPSSRFSGGLEVETSEFLDSYGYNLVNANLSGPIIKKKDSEETILGFRLAGQYRQRLDDDPAAINVFKVSPEVLSELEANPIIEFGNAFVPAGEFVDYSGVEEFAYRPNEEDKRYDITAKLDARLSKNIDVSFTGTYNQNVDRFTPSGYSSNAAQISWTQFNSHNNPYQTSTRYRGNFRLRHRLGSQNVDSEERRDPSTIRNASYTLQFGYEQFLDNIQDTRHEDNFFDYGYVGNFDYEWVPALGNPINPETYPAFLQHRDYTRTYNGYTSGDINPVLANYNNFVDVDAALEPEFPAENGFIATNYSRIWNLHSNVGQVYNLYRKRDQETLNFRASSSFELWPSNSEDAKHNIQFGVLYEQRTERGYDLNPFALWRIAEQQANRNILGVDTTGTFDYFNAGIIGGGVIGDTIVFGEAIPLYGVVTAEQEELLFYQRVRDVVGAGSGDFVNVHELNPDQMSLDMFSSAELTGQNILDYWGYDYLGNTIEASFDDFFTATDENGVRTFPVGAFRPNYLAAYIQDRFTFRDIIFRVGVRVDRYDANTNVLKDPYSLYDIMGANDFHAQFGGEAPETIGDDFKVYLDGANSDNVKAYRDGDQWYFPNGTEANDGSLIFGQTVVTPKYTVDDPNIQRRGFDPSITFEDYTPQVNVMPRLAFSFPISNEANFFAHYDVLVQRPPSNTVATPIDYYYFAERTQIRNNPNLRPERTIDYEVGFQQKLTNSSALKVSAYYKELRDMIQFRTFLYVPGINGQQYDTYDNLDFGTVKGFTFQYDLRRTGNVSLLAAYTLQFADGTGSDANSSRGLSSRGLQRILYPLSFDERHRINISMDYRYASGKAYNGPRLFGADIFANAGLNLQAIAVSGRPYTAKIVPDLLGGSSTQGAINGSRLPWSFVVNIRLDKDFTLVQPKEDGRGGLNMNVYLRVANLLDTRNVANVYPATGSAADDGYLDSFLGLDAIQSVAGSGRSVDAFVASYQWRMLNPNFYTLPRRIFLGAIFDF